MLDLLVESSHVSHSKIFYDVGWRPEPLCFMSLFSGQAPHNLVGSHDGHPRDLKKEIREHFSKHFDSVWEIAT
jgi:hypothetical protein